MKRVLITFVALIGLSMAFNAEAQGLGGLLKKGKNAIEKGKNTIEQGEKVAKAILGDDTKVDKNAEKSVAAIDVNGIQVINPLKSSIEIEPVGLYGISRTEKKGDAYLVLKVKMLEDKENVLIGSSIKNKKMIAADNDGNVYNIDASGGLRYDTPADMVVKIVMDDPQVMFTGINKQLEVMPMVKIGVLIDAYHQDNLTFKNVPIFWDVDPE